MASLEPSIWSGYLWLLHGTPLHAWAVDVKAAAPQRFLCANVVASGSGVVATLWCKIAA
jgi:hypothetical protein